jgi:hypothetical protein
MAKKRFDPASGISSQNQAYPVECDGFTDVGDDKEW